MFLLLPAHLSTALLRDWLNENELSYFDSAMCNTNGRIRFLHILNQPYFVIDGLISKHEVPLTYYLWLVARRIKVRMLKSSGSLVKCPEALLQIPVSNIVEMQIISAPPCVSEFNLMQLLMLAPNVTDLSLKDSGSCKDKLVCFIADNFPNLMKLDISHTNKMYCDRYSNESIDRIITKCCNLKSILLAGFKKLSLATFQKALKSKNLNTFDVRDCDLFLELDIYDYVADYHQLHNFYSDRFTFETDSVTGEQLLIYYNSSIIYKIDSFLTYFKRVSTFIAPYTNISKKCIIAVTMLFPNVTTLTLNGYCGEVTDDCISLLTTECRDITDITLSNAVNITDKSLEYLASGKQSLRAINLHCKLITNVGMTSLADWCSATLTNVTLYDCPLLTNTSIVHLITVCLGLQMLDITAAHSIECNDELLETIAYNCPQFRQILVRDSVHVTERGVSALVDKCVDLRVFNFDSVDISDDTYSLIAQRSKAIGILAIHHFHRVTIETLASIVRNCKELTAIHTYVLCHDVQHVSSDFSSDSSGDSCSDSNEFVRGVAELIRNIPRITLVEN